MASNRSKISRVLAIAGLVGVALIGEAAPARGQHTADPYNPYNQEYDSYVYSQFPTSPGLLPNQVILDGRSSIRGANQFQSFMNRTDTFGAEDVYGPRRTGPGVPYYSAYRRYDRDYDRYYQPNTSSNRAYFRDQQARQQKYLDYLKERDPKRRVQLYREYSQANLRASRDLSSRRATVGHPGSSESAGDELGEAPVQRPRSTAPGSASLLGRRPRRPASGSGATPSSTTRARIPNPSEVLRRSREAGGTESSAPSR